MEVDDVALREIWVKRVGGGELGVGPLAISYPVLAGEPRRPKLAQPGRCLGVAWVTPR